MRYGTWMSDIIEQISCQKRGIARSALVGWKSELPRLYKEGKGTVFQLEEDNSDIWEFR